MTVTAEERKEIKARGFAYFGGIQKKRYWTPDGREILTVPAMRTFNIVKEGKVVSSGVRDANLDNGWLEQKPETLKHYCPYCDKWHDSVEEVDKCGERKLANSKKYEKLALKEKQGEDSELNNLKVEVSEIKEDMSAIKDMLMHLLKKE